MFCVDFEMFLHLVIVIVMFRGYLPATWWWFLVFVTLDYRLMSTRITVLGLFKIKLLSFEIDLGIDPPSSFKSWNTTLLRINIIQMSHVHLNVLITLSEFRHSYNFEWLHKLFKFLQMTTSQNMGRASSASSIVYWRKSRLEIFWEVQCHIVVIWKEH